MQIFLISLEFFAGAIQNSRDIDLWDGNFEEIFASNVFSTCNSFLALQLAGSPGKSRTQFDLENLD